MLENISIERECALRRIRLLVARVEQDCSVRHPQLCRLRVMFDEIERPLSHTDIISLVDILRCTADCTGSGHCDMLRRDLESELRELDSMATGAPVTESPGHRVRRTAADTGPEGGRAGQGQRVIA